MGTLKAGDTGKDDMVGVEDEAGEGAAEEDFFFRLKKPMMKISDEAAEVE